MLDSDEVLALNAILDDAVAKSKEGDDGDPIFHDVNVEDVNPFADERTQSDVYDKLAKKGLIECSGYEDTTGRTEEYVCITPSGLDALKSMGGVH